MNVSVCVAYRRWINAAAGYFLLFCIKAFVYLFVSANNISSDLVNYILSVHSLECGGMPFFAYSWQIAGWHLAKIKNDNANTANKNATVHKQITHRQTFYSFGLCCWNDTSGATLMWNSFQNFCSMQEVSHALFH